MSTCGGQVRFADGTVMYGEYHGTSDLMADALWPTYDEFVAHWKRQPWRKCTCGNDEPVRIASEYGGSFHWDGRACKTCMVITDGHDPYGDAHIGLSMEKPIDTKQVHGVPDWWDGGDDDRDQM